MSQELIKAERAALIQSVKALYIPLSLFIACVISAGGMYMVFYTEDKSPGYAFLGVAFTIIVSAFMALIRFQNNYRAKGVIGRAEASGEAEVQEETTMERTEEADAVTAGIPAGATGVVPGPIAGAASGAEIATESGKTPTAAR